MSGGGQTGPPPSWSTPDGYPRTGGGYPLESSKEIRVQVHVYVKSMDHWEYHCLSYAAFPMHWWPTQIRNAFKYTTGLNFQSRGKTSYLSDQSSSIKPIWEHWANRLGLAWWSLGDIAGDNQHLINVPGISCRRHIISSGYTCKSRLHARTAQYFMLGTFNCLC